MDKSLQPSNLIEEISLHPKALSTNNFLDFNQHKIAQKAKKYLSMKNLI